MASTDIVPVKGVVLPANVRSVPREELEARRGGPKMTKRRRYGVPAGAGGSTRDVVIEDPIFGEIGTSGLRQYGGFVLEEWLPKLRGRYGAWAYRELMDNSPIVGGIMFAIRQLARQVTWRVEDDIEMASRPDGFVLSAMHDMSHTWTDFVSEALSMCGYGWALHETVMKTCRGSDPAPRSAFEPILDTIGTASNPSATTEETGEPPKSEYDDGLITWRRMPIRAQETLMRWLFQGYSSLRGMEQIDWHGGKHNVPIGKSLLFRTETTRQNPEGRALALDTPIPTPDGWRTMGDMQAGSRVFDEQGRVRYVTGTQDWHERPCYEVTFSDGSTIVADENHEWLTRTAAERSLGQAGALRSTRAIALTLQSHGGRASNHSIDWAGPLDYAEQHLAFDPYVLGLWLGDGSKHAPRITCHADDVEEQAVLIAAAGYETTQRVNGRPEEQGRILDVRGPAKWVDPPVRALRGLEVIENKHIPAHYLRGSVEQRLALLQGLMDSDGHVDEYGRCEFANTNIRLINGCAELVRSLGVGCRVALRHTVGKSRSGKTRRLDGYSVKFTPPFSVFRLARKAARCGKPHARPRHYIVDCRRVQDRATRCIEVDGPSHLFLAGRGLVASHNSLLRNAWTSFFALNNIQTIEAIGVERDLAGIPVLTPPDGVDLSQPAFTRLLAIAEDLVQGIRRDEDEGVVLPQKGWELELLSTGGSRQIDTDAVIRRYEQRMTVALLADFLILGQDSLGSYAMVDVKSDLFGLAVDAILDQICDVLNRYAIPRLLALNGLKPEKKPRIAHASVGRVDLRTIGEFLSNLSIAGAPIPWTEELMRHLWHGAALPEPSFEAKDQLPMAQPNPTAHDSQWRPSWGSENTPAPAPPVERDHIAKAEQHTGAMIALYPEPDVARELAQTGGEDPAELHLTLAYLGSAAGLDDTSRLEALVRGFAAGMPPLEGIIQGAGQFASTVDGPCVYATPDVPGLERVRHRLVEHLEHAGFPVSREHGFTPHITLAYGAAGEHVPRLPTLPVRFDHISLVMAGRRLHFPLSQAAVVKADPHAAPVDELLRTRQRELAMQLEREMESALGQLGQQAATAYATVVRGAHTPREADRLAGSVMAKARVGDFARGRLLALMRNHAARVAEDTVRALRGHLPGAPHLNEAAVRRITQTAGRHLRQRDLEPQVRAAVADVISEGLAANETPTQVAHRIAEAVPRGRFRLAGAKWRAQLIASEETNSLQRAASLELYRAAPEITHVEADGQIIPLDEAIEQAPRLHPAATLIYRPVLDR